MRKAVVRPSGKKPMNTASAASLKYDPERDYAPTVTAAGKGYVAEKIVEAARGAGVPVYRDKALAETLSGLRVGAMIPRELYEIVAEVLAYIINIDQAHSHTASPIVTDRERDGE